jgi:hypothetical protein
MSHNTTALQEAPASSSSCAADSSSSPSQISASALGQQARAATTLLQALPPRYGEVLLNLLDRLESSALFTEESCSFSQKDLLDNLRPTRPQARSSASAATAEPKISASAWAAPALASCRRACQLSRGQPSLGKPLTMPSTAGQPAATQLRVHH